MSTTFKYINHACFMLSHEGHNIIFDPYLESCPKFKEGDMEALKGLNVEYILVSHAHFDHIGSAFDIAKACDATIISTAEVAGLAGENGCKAHGMHLGGTHKFDFGHVRIVPAFHGSGVAGGHACGFIVDFTAPNCILPVTPPCLAICSFCSALTRLITPCCLSAITLPWARLTQRLPLSS